MVNNSNDRSILEWYDFFDPDFVFTGTSLPAKIEFGFLIEAKSRKLKHIHLLITGLTCLKDLNILKNIFTS